MAANANGHLKQSDGLSASSASARSQRKPATTRFTSILVRLFIWYTAFTVLFRCPSSIDDLTASSPAVCEPYFNVRAAALPHIQPYYDTYLSPYAERAQPYVNKARHTVYLPAVALAKKHGAPRLAQLHQYGEKQWDRTVRPQLDHVRASLLQQYHAILDPHVNKVADRVMPYYTSIKTSTTDFYQLELLPAYKHTLPYAQRLFATLSDFVVDTALPYTQWTADMTFTFVRRQVWPRLQLLYGENVEPQIFKISQRLGRYRDEKKVEAAASAVDTSTTATASSFSATAPASTAAASVAATISSSIDSIVTEASSFIAATPSLAAPVEEVNPAELFAKDLELWQDQVAKAVHEGAEHLRERVDEICDRLINAQVKNVGEPLIIRLEEGSASAFISLKAKVASVIASLPEDATDDDVALAEEKILNEVRNAGQGVKQRAQKIREWRATYDSDAKALIEAAANSTLETVDNIRDLRLQDIGRRWASNSAITHKDWAKYNELKKASSRWREDLEVVAKNHPRLPEVRHAATEIEERAMAVAEETAKELSRLKDVSKWKLEARDSSTDFDTKYAPPIAAKAKQGVIDAISNAKEAIIGSSQGSVESATSVASLKAASVASVASEAIIGSQTGSVESIASQVSAKVLGTEQAVHESIASVVAQSASVASENAQTVVSAVSESIIGTEPGVIEQAATKVSEVVLGRETPMIESLSSAASSLVQDVPLPSDAKLGPNAASALSNIKSRASAASSSASSAASDAGSMASSSSKSATSLATKASESLASAASRLPPAMPDMRDASEAASSVASHGSMLASSIASQVSKSAALLASQASSNLPDASSASKAASSISSQGSDAASSISSQASQSAESAASQASSNLPGSSSASIASEKATKKVLGGVMAQAVPSARSIVLDDDIIDDDETYSFNVQAMMSKAGDKASELTQAVQDAINPSSTQGSVASITSLASKQYESALSAASSVLIGSEQGTGESIASVASERYMEAVSAASNVVYGTPSPASSFLSTVSASGSSLASVAADQASSHYEQALSLASSHYAMAKSQISIQVSGTPKPIHEEMFASVESAYSDSLSVASKNLQAALSYTSALALPTMNTQIFSSVSSIASSRLAEGISMASAQYSSAKVAAGIAPTSVQQQYLADAQKNYYAAIGYAYDRYAAFESAGRDLASQASSNFLPSSTPAYESLLSAASSQYSAASAAASSNMQNLLSSASSVVDFDPAAVAASASSQYSIALSAASATLASVSSRASEGIYGSSTPAYESFLSDASSHLSTALSGTQTAWTEAMATQASANWEALVSRASEQVYGSPTPWSNSLLSQVGDYAAQATDAAADQYGAVAALFSEIVVGREPDFTESVMNRLHSAYYTGGAAVVSSASSYASDAYASASSVVVSVFTPPAAIEALIDDAQVQIDAAVEAMSVQFYGTSKGAYEQATEAAASMYEDASSKASEAIYGSQTGYAEAAQSSISDVAASAQAAISSALFGAPTGTVESATNAAAAAYSSITSAAGENLNAAGSKVVEGYGSASSAVSSAVYGPELGALESAQSRISAAMESARSRMSEFGVSASIVAQDYASEAASSFNSAGEVASEYAHEAASSISSAGGVASEYAQEVASTISSAASSVTSMIKDEL